MQEASCDAPDVTLQASLSSPAGDNNSRSSLVGNAHAGGLLPHSTLSVNAPTAAGLSLAAGVFVCMWGLLRSRNGQAGHCSENTSWLATTSPYEGNAP